VSLPDYQTLMRPLLELHADGAELDRPTVRALLAEQFRLTPEELVEVLPSGRQRKFDNRAPGRLRTWSRLVCWNGRDAG
jgi:restriction system protein